MADKPEDDPQAQRDHHSEKDSDPSRRDLLSVALNAGVALSRGASYGMLGGYAISYLYPTQSEPKSWLYVSQVGTIPTGGQVKFIAPSGASVAVARIAEGADSNCFIALSSTCPHMGCQVQWEANKNRFFCPCHNGVFNERGEGIDGPPKGQSLARYPIKVENGLLFIEVAIEALPQQKKQLASVNTRSGCLREPRRLPVLPSGGRGGDSDGHA